MTFQAYAQDADPVIATAANILIGIDTDHKAGKLSDSEYAELVKDALDLQQIEQVTADDIRRQHLVATYHILATLAGILLPLV